jgi:hypothetical protein
MKRMLMKLKALMVAVVLSMLFPIAGTLYAANGDLVVNGNLSVGTGVTFPDGTTQTAAAPSNSLVWDYTVTGSAVTSATSPALDGNAHGGYEFEFIIYNPTSGNITPRIYYNNDQVNTNYWVARFGYTWANDSRMIDNIGPRVTYVAHGTIKITPSGLISTVFDWMLLPNGDGGHWVNNKTAAVTNLTRIDIVSIVANGIGVNSRFRLWRRN